MINKSKQKSKFRAYGVFTTSYEYGVIAFSETRNAVKSLVHGTDGFDEYIEIVATRKPELDFLRDEECILDWKRDARIYYEFRWYQADGTQDCDWCGRYEYPEFPESTLWPCGDDDVCKACRDFERNKRA